MSKSASISTLVLVFVAIFSLCKAASIDELLGDPMLVQEQIACVLDRGKCTGFGNSLKVSLKELIGNNCDRCNEKQKANARKLVDFMENNYRMDWDEIVAAYQPKPQRRNFSLN